MGIKIGEIDITKQGLDNEFRLGVLELLLEKIINDNPSLIKPNQGDLDTLRRKVVEQLQNKYPNSGIKLNN